eukprot:8403115-Pyramimonas_sp.AAC.1
MQNSRVNRHAGHCLGQAWRRTEHCFFMPVILATDHARERCAMSRDCIVECCSFSDGCPPGAARERDARHLRGRRNRRQRQRRRYDAGTCSFGSLLQRWRLQSWRKNIVAS